MDISVKEKYEVPAAEVVEITTCTGILQMSQQDYVFAGLDE